jgi:hypothetical protein
MRTLLASVLFLSLSASAFGQSARVIPGPSAEPFVSQTDAGAAGDFQIVALATLKTFCNPYGGGSATAPKGVPDLLFYDRASGSALLVEPDATAWLGYVVETFRFVALRPGMTWTAADLDGDGRDDLIGHHAASGDVVRVFRRGAPLC